MTEETLFHEALARPPGERAAFLKAACEGAPGLLEAVGALLAAHEASEGFLGGPPEGIDRTVDADPVPAPTVRDATAEHTPDPNAASIPPHAAGEREANGLIAGRYTLQERIGEGGMGEVWIAQQSEPVKRRVALKLIKPGMDSRAVLQRFEQERQALALMDHPSIAKVLDAGMTPGGRPFFVMELVDGLPLTRFCDERKLTPRQRLELFVPICQAVQHAHQKGIVHRDLKPANILIATIDGKAVPKVIDFGVAKATAGKLTEESLSTQFGSVVGTLEYMSPEQAGSSGDDIDTRSDIYSLGVILYELLTGLRPIDARRLKRAALTEMIRVIREEEPSKPSTRLSTDGSLPSLAALRQTEPRKLMAMLRGELDWVVMKCLEKSRERRYETADALARDVQRYLTDEPVEARPPSAGYRFRKFVRRNQGRAIAAGLLLLALVGGIIGTSIGLVRADRARDAEVKQRRIAEREKGKAERSEGLAQEQRARAEQRERLAIDAVKRFRDAVANNPELKNSPALDALRKTLLKEPLAFFKDLRDRLQADRDPSPESLERLADAGEALGLLTGEIGDKQDALVAYQHALSVRQKLADAHPDVKAFQDNLAVAQNVIGVLLRDIGQPADAMRSFESALAIWQKLAAADPSAARTQGDVAGAHHNIGMLLQVTGKPTEALRAYRRALAAQQTLADAHPEVAMHQAYLANHQEGIGAVLNETGDLGGALKSFASALAIRRKLAEANPDVVRFQSSVAESQNNLGALLIAAGKPAEALSAFEASASIRRKLVEANPTATQYQRDLAASQYNLSRLLKATGKREEARKAQESALTIQRKLAKEHPESPDLASDLGKSLNGLAIFEFEARRSEEARSLLWEAVDWQRKAITADPSHAGYRQHMGNHVRNLIAVARSLGDTEAVARAERELAGFLGPDPATKALDARLNAVLKEGQRPRDNAEALALAQRAYDKGLHASAVRLWGEALANDPKLADDRRAQYRYDAACAASLAASGRGRDEPAPDEAARARLREQALDWLGAELSEWKRVAMTNAPGDRETVAKTLAHWKQDGDLAGIRDDAALAGLPAEERTALKRFWGDVDALLGQAAGGK